MATELKVLTEEEYKVIEEQNDRDSLTLLKASVEILEKDKLIQQKDVLITQLECQVELLRLFCENFMESMEGFEDSDKTILSYEHRDEYVEAAEYFERKFGRINNRIKEMRAAMESHTC
jgi:hypothetical protein